MAPAFTKPERSDEWIAILIVVGVTPVSDAVLGALVVDTFAPGALVCDEPPSESSPQPLAMIASANPAIANLPRCSFIGPPPIVDARRVRRRVPADPLPVGTSITCCVNPQASIVTDFTWSTVSTRGRRTASIGSPLDSRTALLSDAFS
jgi:hypothetical protein